MLLSVEMGLHMCLGVDLGGFRHCMWVNGGELCYFRPSELVSPRREYQSTHCHENSPRRPVHVLSDAMSRSGEGVSPEREIVKIPRCPSRLSENSWSGHVARLAWARIRDETLLLFSPGRESAASGRPVSRLSESARGCYVSLAVKWFIACIVLIFFLLNMIWVNMLGCFGFYERNWHA